LEYRLNEENHSIKKDLSHSSRGDRPFFLGIHTMLVELFKKIGNSGTVKRLTGK